MNTFGIRLTEERKRLGFSQEDFAEICGVKRIAQGRYEKGARQPDSNYLMAASQAGVDVTYLITGIRSPEQPAGELLTPRKVALLDNYDHLTESDKAALERHALVLAQQIHLKGKTA